MGFFLSRTLPIFDVTSLSVVVVGWGWGADVSASYNKGDVRVQEVHVYAQTHWNSDTSSFKLLIGRSVNQKLRPALTADTERPYTTREFPSLHSSSSD